MIKVQNQPGHARLLTDKCQQNAKLKTSFCFGAEEPTFCYWREHFFPMSLGPVHWSCLYEFSWQRVLGARSSHLQPCERDLLCIGPCAPFLGLTPSFAFIGMEGKEYTASPSLPQPAGDLPRALKPSDSA